MNEQDKKETDTLEFQVIDKRQFMDLDKIDISAPAEEKPRYPTYVEELMARMAETERRFEEKKKLVDDEINRTKARLEADFQRRIELEKQKIVLPLLEVMDNLQRAIEAASQGGTVGGLLEGVRMTANLFHTKLQSLGVEHIPALGQPFDPNLQQAVGTIHIKDKNLDGTVVEELQSGYNMNGQLLRPAQVRIGNYD
jgi:molecular chaperone GrpE